MDVMTLALAKAYTDEQVEKATSGGVDLSEYAKKEEVLKIVQEAYPTWTGGEY